MPHPFPLATVFTEGMRRDVDRTELPGGSAYNMVDFIPDEAAAITAGRGGWTYAFNSIATVLDIYAMGLYRDTGKIIGITRKSAAPLVDFWNLTDGTHITQSTIGLPTQNPFYHRGKLIFPLVAPNFVLAYDGSTGTALTNLGISSSYNPVGCVYKDHTIIANAQTYSGRLYFSAAGDPTTWDTTFGWWDTSEYVTGLAPLLNCVLIFHPGSTERLRGTTPPPGSDMTLEPFADVGCLDPFSIAAWENRVIWAAAQGIYMSDGANLVDITAAAQMKTYWQNLVSGFNTSQWNVTAGIFHNHYIVTIKQFGNTVDTLCVNLNSSSFPTWRFSNIPVRSFLSLKSGSQEELYGALDSVGRVAAFSSMWTPSVTFTSQDANAVGAAPQVETAMFRGFDRLHRRWIESMGKQKWRWAYVNYDLRGAGSPTMALSYSTHPSQNYSQAGLTIPSTTNQTVTRVRRALSPTQGGATHSQMLGLKLAISGVYSAANLYALEAAFSPIEIGAL